MNRKMMLIALSVVSTALIGLPAVASATPAHISEPEAFTISAGPTVPAVFEDVNGNIFTCDEGATGSGSFENTTTGTLTLVFHGCTSGGINCNSPGQPVGTIETTALPFHLIMLVSHAPGLLITPAKDASGNPHVVTYNCSIFVKKEVRGTGLIGTITAPTCGTASTTATLNFEQGATTGLQKHTTYTGADYHWLSNGMKTAHTSEHRIHFPDPKTITCT